jgi:hypothetical protein
VAHAIGSRDIEQRLAGACRALEPIDLTRRVIREKHDARLRARLDDVARTVVFLVGPRLLVFLDQAAVVFIHRKTGRHARLFVIAHAQAVEVDRRLLFAHERRGAGDLAEVRAGLLVNRVGVGIGAGRKVDFGSGDPQKTQGIAVRQRPRFFRADDVIRDGRDARGRLRCGPERAEWTDGSHTQPVILSS